MISSQITARNLGSVRRNQSTSKGAEFFLNAQDDDPGVYEFINDKVTYIDRDFSQCWKLLVHWALILFIHFMLFWYYPMSGN